MNLNLKLLGVRTDNFKESFVPYALLAFVLFIGLIFFLKIGGDSILEGWYRLYGHGLSSIVLVAFAGIAQETFFRGYVIFALKKIYSAAFPVVLADALLFAAFHLFFGDAAIMLPMAFLSGLCFAAVYYYYPNLYLASAVHIALNMAVIPLCGVTAISC